MAQVAFCEGDYPAHELWTDDSSGIAIKSHCFRDRSMQVVLDICKDFSIPFQERPILRHELQHAEELMIVGTTTEIKPIVTSDKKRVGSGRLGTITRRLHKALVEFVASTKKTEAP